MFLASSFLLDWKNVPFENYKIDSTRYLVDTTALNLAKYYYHDLPYYNLAFSISLKERQLIQYLLQCLQQWLWDTMKWNPRWSMQIDKLAISNSLDKFRFENWNCFLNHCEMSVETSWTSNLHISLTQSSLTFKLWWKQSWNQLAPLEFSFKRDEKRS